MKLDSKEINNYLNSAKYDFKLFNMYLTDTEKETINNFTLENNKTFEHFGSLDTLDSLPLLSNINCFLSKLGTNKLSLIKKMEKIILNIIKKVLKGFGIEHFWLAIRVSQPNNDFDICRWHKDGNYFPNDPSKQNMAKFVTVLKGPGTLLIKKTKKTVCIYNDIKKEERKINISYLEQINNITQEERRKLSLKIDEKFRTIYTHKLSKEKVIQVKNNQGLVFYTGEPSDNSALHSEPKHDKPRLFISILPSTKLNIDELKIRYNK
jgi:hypothetical protein